MKQFKVPVVWQSWGVITIEAASKEEAEQLLNDKHYLDELPIPIDSEYIENSYEVDKESSLYLEETEII